MPDLEEESPRDPFGLLGTTVAEKYAVEAVAGQGGFSVVYRAQHRIWKRAVALKVFKLASDLPVSERDRVLEGFVQEGALLAQLSERSAAIVQARDVGTTITPDGRWLPFMVLEWLEGTTLDDVLVRERVAGVEPRTIEETVHLLDSAAQALAMAHERGIAHRDIKPANFFVLGHPRSNDARATDVQLKILDFGIAKVVGDAQKATGFNKTTGVVTAFTPAYGAPEQFSRTFGATGPWTDVFALALVVLEMISGWEPLQGDDLAQFAAAAIDPGKRPTPRTYGVMVSDAVEAVLKRAVAVRPEDRFASAAEFWNALRVAIGLEPHRALSDMQVSRPTPPPRAPAATASAPTVAVAVAAASAPAPMTPQSMTATAPSAARGGSARARVAIMGAVGAIVLAAAAIGVARLGTGRGAASTTASSAASVAASGASASVAPSASMPMPKCSAGMVAIDGGKFFMGTDEKTAFDFEKPAHQVTLAPYCIDKHEVTTAEYFACSDKGECKRAGVVNEWEDISAVEHKAYDPLCNAREREAKANHPINCVDWEDAARFCASTGKRLPTEAEWEFAARGPDGRTYPWGDEAPTADRLNACGKECVKWGKAHGVVLQPMFDVDDGYAGTAPVGSYPRGASRYGVEDVVGNVWEWVADWHGDYTSEEAENPTGPKEGERRVIRGGAWNGSRASWVRPTFRFSGAPKNKSHGIGFRCAKAVN